MYKGPLTHSLHCSEFVELTLILNRFYSDGIICQHGKVSLQFKEVIFSRNQLIREFGIRKGLKKLVISSKIRIFIGENQ